MYCILIKIKNKLLSFWSIRTIRRILEKLEDRELIIVDNHNKDKHNRTKWYAVNYDKLDELTHLTKLSVPCGQIDKSCDKVSTCTSGQVDKSCDKVSTCIINTETTQRLLQK